MTTQKGKRARAGHKQRNTNQKAGDMQEKTHRRDRQLHAEELLGPGEEDTSIFTPLGPLVFPSHSSEVGTVTG